MLQTKKKKHMEIVHCQLSFIIIIIIIMIIIITENVYINKIGKMFS